MITVVMVTLQDWAMWSMRCLFTWQQLLGECVPSLWERIEELMSELL